MFVLRAILPFILCLFQESQGKVSKPFILKLPDVDDIKTLLSGFITPQNGPLGNVSLQCQKASEAYLKGLEDTKNLRNSSLEKLDASALFPLSGVVTDGAIIHHPGAFTGCLEVHDIRNRSRNPGLDGKYCLITLVNYDTYQTIIKNKTSAEKVKLLNHLQENHLDIVWNEDFLPEASLLKAMMKTSRENVDACPKKKVFKLNGLYKIGKCVPKDCTLNDVAIGGSNYLWDLQNKTDILNYEKFGDRLFAIPLSCHTKEDEIDFTVGDIVMIVILSIFGFVILYSTFVDVGINLLNLTYLSKDLLPIVQGFSAHHNIIKIFNISAGPSDGSNLSCINGLKYISISWIVLGHILWEYTPLSGYGVFSSSATAVGEASHPTEFTAVWNGLLGVDTFLVIGGCLLAFHTLKEMDKTKGGNIRMWSMFYIHRYIRLTGVYAIIIGLHCTLLKFLATGPQSHQVTNLVDKCQKGWWMNLLYINNFATDVYGAAKADCINVSWYMAIDMQYFILTPILLTIFWKKPLAGYITSALLLAGGAASQIYFTVKDDEFFHGGFSYYVKPWNRSQPYVVGLLLGYILHRMRNQPTLRIHSIMNLWIWTIMSALACTVLYGVSKWNIVADPTVALPCQPCEDHCDKPSLLVRAIFNGFAKICWSVAVSWVILACVKGKGGPINSILSWGAWVPLARVQYCVYLLHRSIIYIINSHTQYLVRYSHLLLSMQDLAILAITTGVALVFVIMFEAPIVQLEKLLFGALGVGKMPGKRKD